MRLRGQSITGVYLESLLTNSQTAFPRFPQYADEEHTKHLEEQKKSIANSLWYDLDLWLWYVKDGAMIQY